MRCRARWPRPWRPCATRSGTSSCGPGCSGSRTTRRSPGCASAGIRWTSMRSGRWGRIRWPQTVEDRERLALLRADLRDLPERQRSALVLRELSGLSHEEIAVVLDSSARAVKQTIFEARAGLHECAEGRTMLCADVQRALSDGDGRVLRGRRMRAHVRSCRACRTFKTALAQRPADLAALAPALPATAGAALLAHLLPGAKAGLVSSAGTAAGAGGGMAATVAAKVAIVAVATATLAGTGTVVRDAVTAPHRSTPSGGGRAVRPRARGRSRRRRPRCARSRAAPIAPGARSDRGHSHATSDRGSSTPSHRREGHAAAGDAARSRPRPRASSTRPRASSTAPRARPPRRPSARRRNRAVVAPASGRPRAIPPIRRRARRRRRRSRPGPPTPSTRPSPTVPRHTPSRPAPRARSRPSTPRPAATSPPGNSGAAHAAK